MDLGGGTRSPETPEPLEKWSRPFLRTLFLVSSCSSVHFDLTIWCGGSDFTGSGPDSGVTSWCGGSELSCVQYVSVCKSFGGRVSVAATSSV